MWAQWAWSLNAPCVLENLEWARALRFVHVCVIIWQNRYYRYNIIITVSSVIKVVFARVSTLLRRCIVLMILSVVWRTVQRTACIFAPIEVPNINRTSCVRLIVRGWRLNRTSGSLPFGGDTDRHFTVLWGFARRGNILEEPPSIKLTEGLSCRRVRSFIICVYYNAYTCSWANNYYCLY